MNKKIVLAIGILALIAVMYSVVGNIREEQEKKAVEKQIKENLQKSFENNEKTLEEAKKNGGVKM